MVLIADLPRPDVLSEAQPSATTLRDPALASLLFEPSLLRHENLDGEQQDDTQCLY